MSINFNLRFFYHNRIHLNYLNTQIQSKYLPSFPARAAILKIPDHVTTLHRSRSITRNLIQLAKSVSGFISCFKIYEIGSQNEGKLNNLNLYEPYLSTQKIAHCRCFSARKSRTGR